MEGHSALLSVPEATAAAVVDTVTADAVAPTAPTAAPGVETTPAPNVDEEDTTPTASGRTLTVS